MLLVFCTADHGGLADYAHEQAHALAMRGHCVVLLAPPSFPDRPALYQKINLLSIPLRCSRFRWLQRLITAATILCQQFSLNRALSLTGARRVLFTSYSEYLSPLWAWSLRLWMIRGVRFAAVVHDPVRNYVVGPYWWHRLSVAQGYSFLSAAFVHASIELDTGLLSLRLPTFVIPHGPYTYPLSTKSPKILRSRLHLPCDARLLLSFGHIRDNKNLDLALHAMVLHPNVWLLISGPEASAGQRTSEYYQLLAKQLGVFNRCFWSVGYQTMSQVADHFAVADAVLLTYSSSFHSASGVMSLAAYYHKLIIASAGESALLETVRRFQLGVVVEPDDSDALAAGISRLFCDPPAPDWQSYELFNSWDRNAQIVADALKIDVDHTS